MKQEEKRKKQRGLVYNSMILFKWLFRASIIVLLGLCLNPVTDLITFPDHHLFIGIKARLDDKDTSKVNKEMVNIPYSDSDLNELKLNSYSIKNGYLKFNTASRVDIIKLNIFIIMEFLMITFILYALYNITKLMVNDQTFSKDNYKNMYKIGIYMVVFNLFRYLDYHLIKLPLIKELFSNSENVLPTGEFPGVGTLFYILVIFILSEVFRQGVLLKEDNDLQI